MEQFLLPDFLKKNPMSSIVNNIEQIPLKDILIRITFTLLQHNLTK